MCAGSKFIQVFLVLFLGILVESMNYGFQERIIRGMEREDNTLAKFIVSLRTKPNNNHICAGSIFNTRFILTAAHCCEGKTGQLRNPEKHKIVAGVITRFNSEKTMQERDVMHFLPHEEYKENDKNICLILLKNGLKENGVNVKRIPLTSRPPDTTSTYVTFGWGRTFEDGPMANKIRYISLNLESNEICQKDYSTSKDDICSLGKESGLCFGDAGSPLISDPSQTDSYELTGIAIGASSPCGFLSIFTNVYEYRNWVNDTVKHYTKYYKLGCATTKLSSLFLVLLTFLHIPLNY